ncbi:MAG TPA: hypothetical protein VL201_02190 [Patescibacteria group bacterium]|nr:hypothetical protein [Patescibacteria group bacterium]
MKFCMSCVSFCSLYKDIEISIKSMQNDQYISLEEFTPYSTDGDSEEEQQNDGVARAKTYGMNMLSNIMTKALPKR